MRPCKSSACTKDGLDKNLHGRLDYQTHKAEYSIRHKAYYKKHHKEISDRTHVLHEQVLDKFGRFCAQCGFKDVRVLQIDHVLNDGHIERKNGVIHNKRRYYEKVLADKENRYQLLCANCNLIKYLEHKAKTNDVEN